MAKFAARFRSMAARLRPMLSDNFFDAESISGIFRMKGDGARSDAAAQSRLPLYRTLTPHSDGAGYWLMVHHEDSRLIWRMFPSMDTSSGAYREMEAYMTDGGSITVFNEADRTQIILNPLSIVPEQVSRLLNDKVLGQAPYFLRFQKNGACLWIAQTKGELESQLYELVSMTEIDVLPTELKVRELDGDVASRIELYRDIVNNPTNWMDEAIVFEAEGTNLHYRSVGRDAPVIAMLGKDWRQSVVGAPFDDGFVDRAYDRETAIAYRRVFETKTPHVSQVSGPIMTHNGPSYQNYYRIITPIPQQSNQVLSVARLAGMAAPFYPSHSDQGCA